MKRLIIRGALLPLFFMCSSLFSQDGLEKYFSVFYNNIDNYKKWYQTDKTDFFKDIFIELYNLPRSVNRNIDKTAKLRILKSFSKDEEYGYIYLDIKSSTHFDAVLYGVGEGEVFINGKSEGKIKISSDTGYLYLSGAFEKGVFFMLFKITKRMKDAPVIMLSNKDFTISDEGGFTRNAHYLLKIKNIENNISKYDFLDLYRSFCFPYFSKTDRDHFFSIVLKEKRTSFSKPFLLGDIFNSLYGKKEKESLLENGFSQTQVDWWIEQFSSGEICRYE